MQQDYELIKTYLKQLKSMGNFELPSISSDIRRLGLASSKQATTHPSQVAMTPIMKNMLIAFGDLDDGERLSTDSPKTRAERWLDDTVEQILMQQSKKKLDHYDDHLPLRSVQHYYTDCWLNFNPEKWRDIQPGQVEELVKTIGVYAKPTEDIKLNYNDPELVKTIELVSDDLPRVSASREIREINLPFMTKHTNVGYPYFGNDTRKLSPSDNHTLAQVTMAEAMDHKDDIGWLYKNNVTTEYARYQRGKGRLIQAVSRRVNLVLNQLESVEISNYKIKSSLFAGYNDAEYLRKVLSSMTDFCEQRGYGMYNIDYHRYDQHVSKEWINLLGAISAARCVDERSVRLALARANLMTKSILIAGSINDVVRTYGRIFSGFIDTNRGGGVINALVITLLLMRQDHHYVRDIATQNYWRMLVMGDDNLSIYNPAFFSLSRLQKEASQLGFEIDDASKIAYGPKFLQYRLFNDESQGRDVMIYPWTRVLRSMLFKERSSGLGPCGWTLAFYQQLAKLIECPTFLAPVVNIIAKFDAQHLMTDIPIDQIIAGAAKEDREASESREGKSKARLFKSTAEILNDGDPSKSNQFNPDGSLKPDYFGKIQEAIKSVYDPNYLPKHGITAPPLKVK